MTIIRRAVNNDLEYLAKLFEELVEEPTNIAKMKENFKVIQENMNYIILVA